MLDAFRQLAGEYGGAAWALECAAVCLAWVILRHGGLKKAFRWQTLGEFAALLAALGGVTLGCAALCGPGGALPPLRMLAQSAVGALYLLRFSGYRKQTKRLLGLSLAAACMSVSGIAGQCGALMAQSGGQTVWVAARVAVHCTLIPAALWLAHFEFDDLPPVPARELWMIGADILGVLLLYAVEAFSFGENAVWLAAALLAGYTGMLVMLFFAVNALDALCRAREAVTELQAEKQRAADQREQARMAEDALRELRGIRHDLKNQYAYMQILLSEKRYDELAAYFSGLNQGLPAPLNLADCGNRTVNTVLNMAFSKLRDDPIFLRHTLAVPPALPFKDQDLCALLSNLTDNAAEECRRLIRAGAESADIHLDIHPHQSYLIIRCDNPTDRTALTRKNGGLQTTKGDETQHGYGTRNIVKLAEKYNGTADFSLADGRFVAQVMLDLHAEAKP